MHTTRAGTVSTQTFFGGTAVHQIRSMWQDVYRIEAMLSTGFLKFNCCSWIKCWSGPGALGAQEKGKSMTSYCHTWFDCFPYSSLRIFVKLICIQHKHCIFKSIINHLCSPDIETWAPMYFFFAFFFIFCAISSSLLLPSDGSASECCSSFVSVTSSVFLFSPFLREAIFFWVKNKHVVRHS